MMFQRQRARMFWPFVIPAIIFYSVFVIFPLLGAFPLSLTRWDGVERMTEARFVGLDNFVRLLTRDDEFPKAFLTTLHFMLWGFLVLPLGLYFATFSNGPENWRRALRSFVFLPGILPITALALLWLYIYNYHFGMLNGILRGLGLDAWTNAWLTDKKTVVAAIAIPGVWAGIGGSMLWFIAALRRVPTDLVDAARVDGAGPWQMFRHITWPLLWEVTRLLVLLNVIGGLQTFGWVFVLTGAKFQYGPGNAANVIGTYLYSVAFGDFRMGYATAIGIIMLILVGSVAILMERISRREGFEF